MAQISIKPPAGNKIKAYRQPNLTDEHIDNASLIVRALMMGLVIQIQNGRYILGNDLNIQKIGYQHLAGELFGEVLLPTKYTMADIISLAQAMSKDEESKIVIEVGMNLTKYNE